MKPEYLAWLRAEMQAARVRRDAERSKSELEFMAAVDARVRKENQKYFARAHGIVLH